MLLDAQSSPAAPPATALPDRARAPLAANAPDQSPHKPAESSADIATDAAAEAPPRQVSFTARPAVALGSDDNVDANADANADADAAGAAPAPPACATPIAVGLAPPGLSIAPPMGESPPAPEFADARSVIAPAAPFLPVSETDPITTSLPQAALAPDADAPAEANLPQSESDSAPAPKSAGTPPSAPPPSTLPNAEHSENANAAPLKPDAAPHPPIEARATTDHAPPELKHIPAGSLNVTKPTQPDAPATSETTTQSAPAMTTEVPATGKKISILQTAAAGAADADPPEQSQGVAQAAEADAPEVETPDVGKSSPAALPSEHAKTKAATAHYPAPEQHPADSNTAPAIRAAASATAPAATGDTAAALAALPPVHPPASPHAHVIAALAVTASPVALPDLPLAIATEARNGNSRFEIRLDPPELGRIDVRLDIDHRNNVVSRLVAERPETLDLLRRDAAQIERALQDAGLKTGEQSLQFSLRQHAAPDKPAAPAAHLMAEEAVPPPAIQQVYARPLGAGAGIDIRV